MNNLAPHSVSATGQRPRAGRLSSAEEDVAAYYRSLCARREAATRSSLYSRLLHRIWQRLRSAATSTPVCATIGSSLPSAASCSSAAPVPRKLLVVDDHPDSMEVLMRMLDKFGYQAECVASAADALSRVTAAADRPALLLVDIMMPDMDGVELLKAVRQSPGCERLPVLMLTADPGRSVEAFRYGAQDYIMKPADFGRLRASVDRYLAAASSPAVSAQ